MIDNPHSLPLVESRYSPTKIWSSAGFDEWIRLSWSVVEFSTVTVCFPAAFRSPTFKVICRRAHKVAHTNEKYTATHRLGLYLLVCFLVYTVFFQIQRRQSPRIEVSGLLTEVIEQGLILSECSRPSRQGPQCITWRRGPVHLYANELINSLSCQNRLCHNYYGKSRFAARSFTSVTAMQRTALFLSLSLFYRCVVFPGQQSEPMSTNRTSPREEVLRQQYHSITSILKKNQKKDAL